MLTTFFPPENRDVHEMRKNTLNPDRPHTTIRTVLRTGDAFFMRSHYGNDTGTPHLMSIAS